MNEKRKSQDRGMVYAMKEKLRVNTTEEYLNDIDELQAYSEVYQATKAFLDYAEKAIIFYEKRKSMSGEHTPEASA